MTGSFAVKSNILFFVLTLGLVFPICGVSGAQDLDRINDIVNQARGLAQTARSGAAASQTNTQQSGFNNPFSRSAANATATNRPAVDVGENQIRVNAGGQQFVIPRLNGTPGSGVTTAGGAGLPNGIANVDRAMNLVAGYRNYADAVQLFRNADFNRAAAQMNDLDQAQVQQRMLDPFHSLCLFATGEYIRSAELAYSAASQMPVWGWEQLKGHYENPEFYAQQYERLQLAANDPNADVSVRFLLGYHHLMLGHRNHAGRQFEWVLSKLPNDPVTQRLLNIANQGPPSPIN